MVELREGGIAQIRERLQRARRDGDLPAASNPEALTHYLISVMNGISVQGASGHSRDDLNGVVDLALTAWPG
jgi:hypothetical protein